MKNNIVESIENDLELVKEKYRNIIRIDIIKFCDKHGFNFYCGMGTWFFKANEKCNVPKTWLYNNHLEDEYIIKLNNSVGKFIDMLRDISDSLDSYLCDDYKPQI